jgi:hypothetical protein
MQMLTTLEIFLSFWLVGSTSMAGLFSTTKKTMFLYATSLYPFFNQWALRQIDLDQALGRSIFSLGEQKCLLYLETTSELLSNIYI